MSHILLQFSNPGVTKRVSRFIAKHFGFFPDLEPGRPLSDYHTVISDFASLLILAKKEPRFWSHGDTSPFVITLISRKNGIRFRRQLLKMTDDVIFTPTSLLPLYLRLKILLAETRYRFGIVELNDENYHYMFDHNPEPMWIYDLETLAFLDVNKAACFRYGYTRPEFLTMTIRDIRPPEDIPDLMEDVQQSTDDYNPGRLWCHIRKNGERMYVEISSHHLLYKGRQARHVIARDVTHNIMGQRALKQSEQNFRKLFQDNLAVLLLIDPETGFIVDANQSALAFYGYTREQMLAMKVSDINTMGAESASEIQKVVDRQQIYFTFQHRLSDGSIKDVEVFSSMVIFDDRTVLYSIIHDISDKKKAEEKLHLLSKAIEQTPLSIIITDIDGKIEYVNPGFTSYTGYTPAEVYGRLPNVLKSGHHGVDMYTELWSTIRANKPWVGEVCNKRKNGEVFWVKSVITPVIDLSGKTTHFLAVQEDITEQKRLYDELVMTKERAEEMNRLKTSFLNNMSHELRTPMIGILGFSEYLKENLQKGRLQEMAESLHESSVRLSETLNLILTISQLEAEKLQIANEKVDICEISRFFAGSFTELAERKSLHYHLAISSEPLYCKIDAKLFEQSLHNLLNNAFKYTKQGSVTVTVEREQGITGLATVPFIKISVADTGIGIAKENLELIFDEFRQSSEGLGRSFEGTGLGLSITKKFVEKMDGTICVNSEVGKGSVFTIRFPESVMEEETVSNLSVSELQEESNQLSELLTRIVLLVDDDPNIYEILQIYCGDKVRFFFAQNEDIAIELAAERSYDAVFLDINLMSDVSGLDLLTPMKEMPGFKTVPFVAITAYANDDERDLFLSRGFDFYLAKPFNRRQLWSLLDEVFGK